MSPAGIVLDVADLAKASYDLYQEQSDDNYFQVILCVIGFIPGPGPGPGPGDGVKAGFKIVNKKPEILFELIRFIMTYCKQYGDPEKWLSEIISDTRIRGLIQSAKKAALHASDQNIDNKFAKYWVNQSIELTFDFLENSISTLIQLLARKVLHWKTKVPKTSADLRITGGGTSHKNPTAHNTTYTSKDSGNGKDAGSKKDDGKNKSGKDGKKDDGKGKSGKDSKKDDGKTGQNGDGQGGKGKSLSKADISSTLKNSDVGGVGEHMADYWATNELKIPVTHDDGKSNNKKLQRAMTKLHLGINDQGIDAIFQSDNKNLGIMNTKIYAVIEAKASLSMGIGKGPGSLLNDLAASRDKTIQDKENREAAKAKRKPVKITPQKKYLKDQQMSEKWVEDRLSVVEKRLLFNKYSRHLLYFNYAHPETVEHLNALAVSVQDQKPINHLDHLNGHTPSNFWGAAKIDEAINNRITKANKKNGYP